MTPDSKRTGWMKNMPVQHKMQLAFGLMLMLVIANAAAFYYVQGEQRDARELTTHTYEVISGLQDLQLQAITQQNSLRGYILKADVAFLEPYRDAEKKFNLRLDRLRELTSDSLVQGPRLNRSADVMQAWHQQVALPEIALVQNSATRSQASALVGKGRLLELYDLIHEMEATERKLLVEREDALQGIVRFAIDITAGSLLFGIVLVFFSLRLIRRWVTDPLVHLTGLMTQLSNNDHNIIVPDISRRDEIGALARALQVFKNLVVDIQQRNWVKTNTAQITGQLQSAIHSTDFANTLTGSLAPLLGASVAAFYIMDEHAGLLEFSGSYGYLRAKHGLTQYRLDEGLVGQCARERKPLLIEAIPSDYLRVHSGTGEAAPTAILLLPVMARERLLGVLEFGSFGRFDAQQQSLFDELLPLVALSLDNLQRAQRTQELLKQSQTLGEELQASSEELRVQQEELRATNETLHAKSQQLQLQSARLVASEEELKVQSQELQVSNEELRQKTSILSEQKKDLETLQADTQQKADELARASQYKSEFLANMSHELRTPLNSLLILSRGLADNELGHLDADEVKSATVIHESGDNLLRLINDILDLSKVESGKMELVIESTSLSAFAGALTRNFRHVAKERGLVFEVDLEAGLPSEIETDSGKLEQIVNNLLSNAFKFTQQGTVRVEIARAAAEQGREGDIAIRVIDSGIGIAADKFEKVFQAFEQVDGSTSRQFGGTGLGLSIARGMAQLLGGDIRVTSMPGKGSTFTVLIPSQLRTPRSAIALPTASTAPAVVMVTPRPPPVAFELPDDRNTLKPNDTVILIVEDDPAFARILIDLVRRKGYRALFAADGEGGLKLAREFRPTGILLDVMLPGMDGYSVIEKLKADHSTRHIPVHFISATEDHNRALDLGAVGFLTKPVTRDALGTAFERLLHFAKGNTRRVLVVDDDAGSRLAVRKLIAADTVEVVEAVNGKDALARLGAETFDCVVLDLGMPDMNGFEFLERAAHLRPVPPVVVYSGRDLSTEEHLKLRQYTDSIVIKGARSPERLLDEVSLFLHSMREGPSHPAPESDLTLNGRTVLVVDDDMRNIFALSKALRAKGLNVVMAQDGYKALKQIDERRDIELVLMDIMMPGMDGYQTMGEIRKNPLHSRLPIIALTAKAMRGDREKCLEAGANDYLSKPIDLDKLFSLMRVWLSAR